MLRVSPLTIGAVYKKGDRVGQGYVLNLSRGGVFLSTKEDFQMGEEFRLRFFLPFQLGQVDALVVVRWRTQDVDSPPPQLRAGLGCRPDVGKVLGVLEQLLELLSIYDGRDPATTPSQEHRVACDAGRVNDVGQPCPSLAHGHLAHDVQRR